MKNFLQHLFSESGEASFSRVGSFLALLFSLGWLSYIVWKTRAVPGLEGITFFVSSLYGLGKAGQTIQRMMGGKP
ncbi:MAG: hypothetical protein ACYDA9_05165 [Terriglobia bacterium]|nr:hypothetical protein [Terriglobia bacterium]